FAQGSEATKQSIDPRARKDGLLRGACHHCASAIAQCLGPQLTMRMRMCAVQKWHTSSRRISLCRAICLAKINHMLAAGLHMLEASHMYRSSLALAFAVL